MPRMRMKPFQPEIAEMPERRMAVVHTEGDPSESGPAVMKALYGAAYTLKFALKKQGVKYHPTMPCGRWEYTPGGAQVIDALHGTWGLQVPDDPAEMPQKAPEPRVEVETWPACTVAQILHVGGYDEELPTIEKLVAYAEEQGYEILGPHEEEYWSGPSVKEPKTIIRYGVRKRA